MKNKNRINVKFKPRKCIECGGKLIELKSVDMNGVPYRYWHCIDCREEILDMKQLHESASLIQN